ncbi:MAG: YigZ family protein [Candidatus Gracilibacteria bacterium]|nr:YigZ family protein [Candidatus Gracilibacteria bacterium]
MAINLSLDFGDNKTFLEKKVVLDAIKDRGSIFTPAGGIVKSKEDIHVFLNELVKDKPFKNATHNSYAYRIKLENGSILEGKNDDGETGAGNCILRELQRENYVDSIVVVSRHFGGVHLQSDRYKHIINATKMIL